MRSAERELRRDAEPCNDLVLPRGIDRRRWRERRRGRRRASRAFVDLMIVGMTLLDRTKLRDGPGHRVVRGELADISRRAHRNRYHEKRQRLIATQLESPHTLFEKIAHQPRIEG